jgi:hypothetical protein
VIDQGATNALGILAAVLDAAREVGAIALLELGEVGQGQRAILFGDAGDVGAGVVDPGLFRFRHLGEEGDVGLDAGTVRGEAAARQTQGCRGAPFRQSAAWPVCSEPALPLFRSWLGPSADLVRSLCYIDDLAIL